WDSEGKLLLNVKGHTRRVSPASFSPDSQRVVTGGSCDLPQNCDGTLRVWNIATGEQLLELRGHNERVHSAVFSPDGRWIASAGDDRVVRLWDAQMGGHEEAVTRLMFTADSRWLLSASLDSTVRLWATPREAFKTAAGETVIVLRGHQHSITGMG